MSQVSGNRPNPLNWETIGQKKRLPEEKDTELPKPSTELAENAFLHPEQENPEKVNKEKPLSKNSLVATANLLIKNADTLSHADFDASTISKELNSVEQLLGNLDHKDTHKNAHWFSVTTKDGNSTWIYIRPELGLIGFANSSNMLDVYSQTSQDNELGVVAEVFMPLLTLFKVSEKKRLQDPNFLAKVLSESAFDNQESMIDSLTNFLKAQQISLPNPQKAPYLYSKMSDKIQDPNNDSQGREFLKMAMGLKGNLSAETLELFFRREKFLKTLDHFTEELKKIAADTTPDANSLSQLLHESRVLTVMGYQMNKKGELKETEQQALLNALNFYKDKTNSFLEKMLPKKSLLSCEIDLTPIDIPELALQLDEDSKKSEASSNLDDDKIQTADAGSVDELEQIASIPILENATSEIRSLCEKPETLANGLNLLRGHLLFMQDQGVSDERLLREICLTIPLLGRSDLNKLSEADREAITTSFLEITKTMQKLSESIAKRPQSQNPLTFNDESNKNLNYIASQLAGYLSLGLIAAQEGQEANPYPLDPFIKKLNEGFFLNDPELQKKALLIAKKHFEDKKIDKASVLTNLALPPKNAKKEKEKKTKDESPTIKNIKEYFKNNVFLEAKKIILTNFNLKMDLKSKVERFNISLKWGREHKRIEEKIETDIHDAAKKIKVLYREKLSFEFNEGNLNNRYHDLKQHLEKLDQENSELLENSEALKKSELLESIKEFVARGVPTTKEEFEEFSKLTTKLFDFEFEQREPGTQFKSSQTYDIASKLRAALSGYVESKAKIEEARIKDQEVRTKFNETPLYKNIDFKELQSQIERKNFQEVEDIPYILKLKKQLQNDAFIGLNPTEIVGSQEILNSLSEPLQNKDNEELNSYIKDIASKFRAAAELVGDISKIPDQIEAPSDDEIFNYFVCTSSKEQRQQLFSIKFKLFAIAESALKKEYTDLYFNKKNLDLQKEFLNSSSNLKQLLQDKAKKLISASAPEISGINPYSVRGLNITPKPNEISNKAVNETNFDSVIKELAEASTEKKDSAWKSIGFVFNNPLMLRNQEFYNLVMTNIFDFQRLEHLIEGETGNIHQLVSQHTPKIIDETIQGLQSKLVDPSITKEDKKIALESLGKVLTVFIELKKYLEARNALETEESKKIDLSHYRDYEQIYFDSFGPKLDPDLITTSEMENFSREMLDRLTTHDFYNLSKNKKEALLFNLASLYFNGYEHSSKSIQNQLNNLKSDPLYSQFILHHYFVFGCKDKVPEGLSFDLKKRALIYRGRQEAMYGNGPHSFRGALLYLGILPTRKNWYLYDSTLERALKAVLSKKIGNYIVHQDPQSKLYEVKGTPYLFNEDREVFFRLEKGTLAQYHPGKNPFKDFSFEHLSQEGDLCFDNWEEQKTWVIREGNVVYTCDEQKLVRVKDGSVAFKGQNEGLWFSQKEDGSFVPTSVESKERSLECKFVEKSDQVLLESVSHPGYFLSTTPPICCNVNLADFVENPVMLENADGDRLFIGDLPSGRVEFSLSGDSLRTKNPWHIVELLIEAGDPRLTFPLAQKLYVNPPINNEERQISKQLTEFLKSPPTPESFAAWAQLLMIDRAANGDNSQLYQVEDMQAVIEAYHGYRCFSAYYPETKLSKESERILLQELRSYFSYNEDRIIRELKDLKKAQTDKNAGLLTKLKIKLFGNTSAEAEELKAKLQELRMLYRMAFKIGAEERIGELRSVKKENLSTTWKRITPEKLTNTKLQKALMVIEDWMGNMTPEEKEKEGSDEVQLIDIDTIGKKIGFQLISHESYFDQQALFSGFKSWNDLKGHYQGQSKNTFVEDHLLDFYQLATTLKEGAEKNELLEWLELTGANDKTCAFLADILRGKATPLPIKEIIKKGHGIAKILTQLGGAETLLETEANEAEKKISENQLKRIELYAEIGQIRRAKGPTATIEEIEEKINELDRQEEGLHIQIAVRPDKTKEINNQRTRAKNLYIELTDSQIPVFTTWRKIRAVFSVIAPLFKVYLKQKRMKAPLKLSKMSLERPYSKFKKASDPSTSSPILRYDEAFNDYFKGWSDVLFDVTPPLSNESRLIPDKNPMMIEAKRQMKEYSSIEKAQKYSLKEDADLNGFKEELEKQIKDCHLELKVREASLLHQANATLAGSDELKRMFLGKSLDWKDLTNLVYKGQEYAYVKHLGNPAELSSIQNGFYQYLAIRTRLYQMERAFETVSKGKLSETQIQRLGEQLSEKRAYDGSNPDDLLILFYEAASPKGLFREDQYEKIQTLGKGERELAEMPTGFGKTAVLIPMMNERRKLAAKKETELKLSSKVKGGVLKSKEILRKGAIKTKELIVNLWPSALAFVNKEEIHKKTELATQGAVQQLIFSRDTRLDSAQLEHFYGRLERAAEKGEPISLRASDFSAIQLHWIELLEDIHTNGRNKEALAKLELYGKILVFIHTSAFVTIDEAHDILDPMQKTIYTIGQFSKVPAEAVDFSVDVFNLLLENDTFNAFINKNESTTPAIVDEVMGEILDDNFLQKFAALTGLKEFSLSELNDFLNGKIPLKAEWKPYEEKLNLAKGYYTVIIKAMISGAVGVTYGFSKLHYENCPYAIPYEKKDMPKESAENKTPSSYQNIDETLLKTLRTYHTIGLNKENLLELTTYHLEALYKARKKNPTRASETIPSYVALRSLFNKAGIEEKQIGDLLNCSFEAKQIKLMAFFDEGVVNALYKDKETMQQFIKLIVAPKIRIYPTSVGMTAQELLGSFSSSLSVSATPQKEKVHSLRTKFVSMIGSTGKMFYLLVSKATLVRQIPENDEKEKQFIEQISIGCNERNVRAIADPSGLKCFDLSFVKKLADGLKNKGPIEYIVFTAPDNSRVRYSIASGQVQPFHDSSHKPAVSLTLYDQARSTGTDIVQSPDSALILLVGEATTAIQAGQGVGRMRQLDKGQTFEMWTSFGHEETTLDEKIYSVIDKLIDNDLQVSLQKNKASFQQLMAADLKGAMVKKMLGLSLSSKPSEKAVIAKVDIKSMLRYFSKFRDEFVENQPYDPTIAYGMIGAKTTGEEILNRHKNSLVTKAGKYFNRLDAARLKKTLGQYEEEWKKVPLPQEDFGVQAGASQEVSSELEVSTETEVSQEENVEIQMATYQETRKHTWQTESSWPKKTKEFASLDFSPKIPLRDRLILKKQENEALKLDAAASQAEPKERKKLEKKRLKIVTERKKQIEALEKKTFGTTSEISFSLARQAIALQLPLELEKGDAFFEDNFVLSTNFSEQQLSSPSPLVNTNSAKPLNHILLVMDEGADKKKKYTGVAIDGYDANQLHILLEKQRADEKDETKRKFAIYSLDMNVVVDQGKNTFTEKELNSADVSALTAQAKLLGGKMHYTPAEKAYLKKKIALIEQSVVNEGKEKTAKIGNSLFTNLLKIFNPPDRKLTKERFQHILET